ncbi:serine/threonine-protein phosphatase 4 regulatory subunit 2-A-like [Cololabis saira]|uniref:serine/threonine-protein phosphatase 4 regulatory subunit 2-A-like n=1 Tax=Cololabis saira TaxID=129043 RepID=UPI002AD38F99|nr:serine/threonine-protein phosphatase 4 regulatory subunit 2-A-like [Cololabis saira]
MDIDAFLDALQDFEKTGKKETCPELEQFLCHVAKTGQPMIPWSQFKTYFMFKLEKVMDDFHASTPEQRGLHNPNVENIPFDEMKKRILKIVDGYNGIPFTIQRLCELLTDPKRNYAGTDKFLRGLEKNVMVVSSVYHTSEKNGASSVNRVNGVMFPGNSSLYSDSRNVNGPTPPKMLTRPKLLMSTSLSTNGLPDCPASKEPVSTTEEEEEHPMSETAPSDEEITPICGIKHKTPLEKEDSEGDKQEAKRLKFDEEEKTECEEKNSSCHERAESSSKSPKEDSSEDSGSHDCKPGSSGDTPSVSDDHEPSSTQREPSESEGDSSEAVAAHTVERGCAVDQSEESPPAQEDASSEKDSGEDNDDNNNSSSSSHGGGLTSDKVSSSSSSPDLSTEGAAETSDNTDTATEPGEHN